MVDDALRAYLDHQAGPDILPEVREAMAAALGEPGDPEALHDWGRAPADRVASARASVAALIGASPDEIVFTSGDVESRNLAVKGTMSALAGRGDHIVASMMEHPATLSACRSSTRRSGSLTLLPVDGLGAIAADDLRAALRPETVLVCVTHAQAEIGTIADLPPLVAAARAGDAHPTVHVDAALTAGLLDIDVATLGADLVTVGCASIGGPPWIGALWVGPQARIHPLIEGGAQEHGKRGGSLDVPAVAGFGVAAEIAQVMRYKRVRTLRERAERLASGLLTIDGVRLNGPPLDERLPGHVQVSVAGADSEALTLMLAVRGVAASPGSACTGAGKSSPVLEAIGLDDPWVHSAVLLTLAATTTDEEIDTAIERFADAVRTLRAMGVAG